MYGSRGRAISLIFLLLLLSGIVLPGLAILDPVDFLALQSIRRSLRDLPGSAFLASWDFTADPCGFPGVFCSGGRVVALALGDPRAGVPGLTGRLDPALGRLSALAEFSLVPGRVFGPIPGALALCSGLRFLALSKNLLSGPISPSFSSLRHLRTLDLSSNLLSGFIPPGLVRIPSLSNLMLSHNRLAGSIPPFPQSSPVLRLDLKRNLLSGQLPALPPSLLYLSLSFNRLSGRVDRVLPRLEHLNYLDLSMNRLSGPVPGSIFSFPISSLQLQRNAFSGLLRLEGKVGIPLVDLSHNRLSGPVPTGLAAARRVYLNDNRFEGEVPAEFAEGLAAGRIELLYLQHNYLTGMAGLKGGGGSVVPAGGSLCLQFNCMVPPVDAPCPLRAGPRKTRAPAQCPHWRGRTG